MIKSRTRCIQKFIVTDAIWFWATFGQHETVRYIATIDMEFIGSFLMQGQSEADGVSRISNIGW